MKGKAQAAVFLLVFLVLGGFLAFFSQYLKQNLAFNLSPITDEELDRILELVMETGGKDVEENREIVLDKDSIINVIHINKKDSEYGVSCWLGEDYEGTGILNDFFPEEPISLGRIRECSIETAQAIDQAVVSENDYCSIFIDSPFPQPTLDYYFVSFLLGEREVTSELVETYKEEKCAQSLESFIGRTMPIFMTALVDLQENKIFY